MTHFKGPAASQDSGAQSGFSFPGGYVSGDKASIDAVVAMFHVKVRCEVLDRMISNKELVQATLSPDIAATGGASADGLEPPGCPVPGACLCPGGEKELSQRLAAAQKVLAAERERADKAEAAAKIIDKHGAEGWRKVAELTEDLVARTGERDELAEKLKLFGAEMLQHARARPPADVLHLEMEAEAFRRDADQATALADALQARVGALEELLIRAQQLVPVYQRNWHADCRTIRAAFAPASPNAKTEGV